MTILKFTLRDWGQMTPVAVISEPAGHSTIFVALQVPTQTWEANPHFQIAEKLLQVWPGHP